MRFLEERRQVLAAAGRFPKVWLWEPGAMLVCVTPEPQCAYYSSGVDYQLMSMEIWCCLTVVIESEGSYKPSLKPLHMEIYRNREGVKAIVHVHSIMPAPLQ